MVVCAGTSWDGVWFPEKHIADRLTDFAPILYVDPPVSVLTRWRDPARAASLKGPRLRLIRPGLARLTPVIPPGIHRLGFPEVGDWHLRHQVRRYTSMLTNRVHAVVAAAPSDPFGACDEQLRVVFATDDWVAGAQLMGIAEGQIRRAEARLAAKADLVVAVSETLADRWRDRGPDTVLIPNGCDSVAFALTDEASSPDDVDLPHPIAGFIGHLSDRIEVSLLEAVAERGRSVLLVGPRQSTFDIHRLDRLMARPNVRWVGARPFEQLPSYMRLVHVGMTPYGDTPFNRASFPLKTLEYLAAGRGAVATELPAVRWMDTDLVRVASTPGAFADAVDTALDEPRTPELAGRRRAFATQHGWAARTARFAKCLDIQER